MALQQDLFSFQIQNNTKKKKPKNKKQTNKQTKNPIHQTNKLIILKKTDLTPKPVHEKFNITKNRKQQKQTNTLPCSNSLKGK